MARLVQLPMGKHSISALGLATPKAGRDSAQEGGGWHIETGKILHTRIPQTLNKNTYSLSTIMVHSNLYQYPFLFSPRKERQTWQTAFAREASASGAEQHRMVEHREQTHRHQVEHQEERNHQHQVD